MQEMKKRRIVLASLLKPVNDTRMFEKMGMSLAQSGQYEVHIVGYPSTAEISEPNIQFHSLPKFKRLGLGRIGARLKVLQFVIKVKPEILLVTTHELLGVAILFRIFFGAKIIYDIQENYGRNILYTNAFPRLIRALLAFFVRLKEWVAAPFFSRFLLAEKCYAKELGFVKNKFVVIENKCKVPQDFQRKPNNDFIQLIFTGTLAESTGVFQAINLVKKLQAAEPKIRLTMIGYGAQRNVLEQIHSVVSQSPFITLVGGQDLVSHATIMHAIATANFGIISYPMTPHIENKTPTKLFEYLACQLPILLQDHKPWGEMCEPCHAAIQVDFDHPDMASILGKIHAEIFYSKEPEGMTWESEERKLLNLVHSIF